jgi:Holliday junction resolvasome RuvABC endonuclease subunit
MLVLGLDPSLTNYGWALHDTSAPVGDPSRCLSRGRFRTAAKTLFIHRYKAQRESLRKLVQDLRPDRVGIEFPVFDNLWSEGMYGLFLYSVEALEEERVDTVFWSPLQVKAHAREAIDRPKGWKMDKADMVEAAKADAAGGRWNHNEADAYLVAVLAGRFWELLEGAITEDDLTPVEAQYLTRTHTFVRGSKAGKTVKTGMVYREQDRYFPWGSSPLE